MSFIATPGHPLPSLARGLLAQFLEPFSWIRGNFPQVRYMGNLLSKKDQAIVDAEWRLQNPDGNNGRCFAAVVSPDGRMVHLWKTSFAARQLRGQTVKGIYIPDFLTVNIASVGVTADGDFVAGDHKQAGIFPFGGVLDILSLIRHAKREIREESGITPYNLRIVGIVRDKRSVNFVGLFDAPSKEECLRLFDRRDDPDGEMTRLIFFPPSAEGIGEVLGQHPKKWAPLGEVLKTALTM
jgi:hypothetical protein